MHTKDGKRNERASKLVGKEITGNVLILSGVKGLHLYQLLRKEFMINHCVKPLSSDAFCGFQHPDFAHIYNDEVHQATQHLFKNVIVQFAEKINRKQLIVFHSSHLIQL